MSPRPDDRRVAGVMKITDIDVLVLEAAGDYGTTDDAGEPHGPNAHACSV